MEISEANLCFLKGIIRGAAYYILLNDDGGSNGNELRGGGEFLLLLFFFFAWKFDDKSARGGRAGDKANYEPSEAPDAWVIIHLRG